LQKFLRLKWQGGIEPPNQNPADVPKEEEEEENVGALVFVEDVVASLARPG